MIARELDTVAREHLAPEATSFTRDISIGQQQWMSIVALGGVFLVFVAYRSTEELVAAAILWGVVSLALVLVGMWQHRRRVYRIELTDDRVIVTTITGKSSYPISDVREMKFQVEIFPPRRDGTRPVRLSANLWLRDAVAGFDQLTEYEYDRLRLFGETLKARNDAVRLDFRREYAEAVDSTVE
jgi:hypothetical protein